MQDHDRPAVNDNADRRPESVVQANGEVGEDLGQQLFGEQDLVVFLHVAERLWSRVGRSERIGVGSKVNASVGRRTSLSYTVY